MKRLIRIYVMLIVLISLLILFNAPAFSQKEQELQPENQVQIQTETPAPQAQLETPKPETAQPQAVEPQTQWLWGEVVSVDTTTNQIVVKYLDYETDTEKEISIYAAAETTYENVAALGEIKPKDTVSIDYITTSDGKNIAKNISVEKLESSEIEPVVPSESEAPKE